MSDYFEEAQEAINRLFSDTSVPRSTTRSLLIDLRDEIDVILDALEND